MINITEEWSLVMFFVGFMLSCFGTFATLIAVYQNTKVGILEKKIRRREESIQEWKDKYENEKRNSGIDSLTGLKNRRYLTEKIGNLIDWAERYKFPLSFVFIDLDNFKKINDTYGHRVGDDVLKKVADKIRNISRHTDTYVRLGGDEFFMALPGTDYKGAKELSLRLEREIRKISKELEINKEIGFGSSLGIFSHKTGLSFEEVMDKSDKKMYRIKERRKR